MQNGFCESFNGRMRGRACQRGPLPWSRSRPRQDRHLGRRLQSAASPIRRSGYLTPAAYADNLNPTGGGLRNLDQLRRPLLLHPRRTA